MEALRSRAGHQSGKGYIEVPVYAVVIKTVNNGQWSKKVVTSPPFERRFSDNDFLLATK